MLENEDNSKEKVNENHDQLLSVPLFPRRLRIKEELVDDSPRPSPSTVNNDDSSSNALLKVRVKPEPLSKLAELKRALELNQGIKLLLGSEIQRVKAAYEKNLEKQKILQQIVDENKDAKVSYKPPSQIRAISVFAYPYFRDVKKMVPPLNEDAKIKRRNQEVNAYLRPPRPWSQEDNKRLLDGVTGFALMSALKPYKIKRDYLKKKMKDQDLLDFEIEVLEKQLLALEKKIKTVSEKPLVELLEEVEGKIDWLNISAVNMQGEKSPEECENIWNNYLNFKINKEVFTFEEDERLKNLAEDNNERDWDRIASKLKTNRTPIQCFERYQTRLNANLRKRYWSPEEDAKLNRLVDQYRCGKIIPWNKISTMMDGRTRQQIINRYERSISQLYSRGPWAVEEDSMLIACYHKYGCRWGRMTPFFHKRSTCHLRERYVNSLDPAIKMGSWTKEEDRLLITLIKRYGWGKWAKICKHIPGRTDNMCLVRAGRLLEYSVRYCSKRGLGEYDPGVNDPETFAKIIRPLAPTKDCVYRNMKLKSNREEALELLVNVVKKTVPGVQMDEDNLESIDFSWLSYEILLRISIELHKILEDRIKNGTFVEKKFPQKFMKKPLPYRKRLFEETDEEDYVQPSPEKPLPPEEQQWLTDTLTTQFQVAGKIMPPTRKRKTINGALIRRKEEYNGREVAEIALYKAYLYKEFHCQAKCDEEDDLENVVFSGIDFSETLQTVVSYFIQPPVYDDQFIVLAPNITNTLAMEVMEATEDRMVSMSKYVSHSKPYVDYICERRRSCPKCLKCLKAENQLPESNREAAKEMAYRMKKDHFFVEKTMQQSIDAETCNLDVSNQACSCEQLRESRNSVKLLRQRFMALFLWPALLASCDFNKEQEESILTEEPISEDHKNYYYRGNLVTRKLGQSSSHYAAKSQRKRKRKANKCHSRNKKKTKISIESSPEMENLNVPHSNDAVEGNRSQTAKKVPCKQRMKRRQSEPPEGLRRSQRQCVKNRSSFSFSNKTKKSKPKKPEESLMEISAVPSNALQNLDPNIALICNESSNCLVATFKEEIDTPEGSQQSNMAVNLNQTDGETSSSA